MVKKILFVTIVFMFYILPCYASDIVVVSGGAIDMSTVDSKTGLNVFQNTVNKLNQLKDINWKESAPIFKINLHWFSSSMKDEEIVFCDFRKLETVQFLGMSVIEYFRFLLSFILYVETGMYVYRKLWGVIPQNVE